MSNKLSFKQTFATLVLFALSIQMVSFSVFAQSFKNVKTEEVATEKQIEPIDEAPQSKIAPELQEKTDDLIYGRIGDRTEKVIIRYKTDTSLNNISGDEFSDKVRVEMFAKEAESNREKTGILVADLASLRGRVKKSYANVGMASAVLPLSKIRELSENPNVAYVSPDLPVQSFGNITATTGNDNSGIWDNGDADPNTYLNGQFGTMVIIDSGIDVNHRNSKWSDGNVKVVYSQDFTGEGVTGDPYGHGTHVASMATGDGLDDWAYTGPSAGASVISLRVLNGYGIGSTSNLIAALDWTVANKAANNIQVINMSLGTAARDSYSNDPLCLAARRAVNAGIVVVASAGNFGKSLTGEKLYGTIGSPGIEPSVITVGAANTLGTEYRSDDTVATFSSRGPTRGYKTLANGARKYDNLMKPDLIAPGNKVMGRVLITTAPKIYWPEHSPCSEPVHRPSIPKK